MTRDDYLHIFRTFWPTEGYAGIVKHLPDWSKSRASASMNDRCTLMQRRQTIC